jgi:hypothetical protein
VLVVGTETCSKDNFKKCRYACLLIFVDPVVLCAFSNAAATPKHFTVCLAARPHEAVITDRW